MAVQDMQQNEMMSHLTAALEAGQDIGHYGRLVFAMVARHFLEEDELVGYLAKNPGFDELQSRALVKQVQGRDYNPPKREKILQFQREQEFPICPTNDPDGCNVYKNLPFPQEVYDKINAYYEQKVSA
jgi:hypothetical protein